MTQFLMDAISARMKRSKLFITRRDLLGISSTPSRRRPEILDMENSEISKDSLGIFAASAAAMNDFETALKID